MAVITVFLVDCVEFNTYIYQTGMADKGAFWELF